MVLNQTSVFAAVCALTTVLCPATLTSASPAAALLVYDRQGGFTGAKSRIEIKPDGQYTATIGFAGDRGTERKGTLLPSQMSELMALVTGMPEYHAPMQDSHGGCLEFHALSVPGQKKSARWTSLSRDVPGRVLQVAEAAEESVRQRPVQRVEVQSASLSLEKKNPPNLLIHAEGQAPADGWKHVHLIAYRYPTTPQDGIWEFDMVGTPPDAASDSTASKVTADFRWLAYPADQVKGIRIHGSDRSVAEVRLAQPPASERETAGSGLMSEEEIALSQASANLTGWNAWQDLMPGGGQRLYVTGSVFVPNPGVEPVLSDKVPQGINPEILLLDLRLIQRPGTWPQVLAWKPVRFEKSGKVRYTKVSICTSGEVCETIEVKKVY